jgi:hypothetical protein
MPRSSDSSNVPDQPIGRAWLRANLDLAVPPPAHESFVGTRARRTEIHGDRVRESYPVSYAVADDLSADASNTDVATADGQRTDRLI